jgi:hypothetical protein
VPKVSIIHDQDGKILSIFVPADEFSEHLSIVPEVGLVAEIDTADFDQELTHALASKAPDRVVALGRMITERYRVDGRDPRRIRIRKRDSG